MYSLSRVHIPRVSASAKCCVWQTCTYEHGVLMVDDLQAS